MIRRPTRLALVGCGAVICALWAPLLLLYAPALRAPDALALMFNALAWRLTFSSLVLCAATAGASTVLGVPLGFLLARGPQRLRAVFAALTALPLGVPAVLAAAPFFSLGGPERFPLWACALALSLVYFPVVSFATAAALSALPREEVEAARALQGAWGAWSGVLGRRILPAIGAAAGAVAALCLWEMGAPDLLSYPTLSSEIYRQLNSPIALGDPNLRAALTAWPVPLLALLFLWPALRIATTPSAPSHASGDGKGARGLLIWGQLLLISPGFLLWRFARELDDRRAIFDTIAANTDALWNTLVVATCAATICTALALFLCLSWRNWPARARHAALALTLVPGLGASVVLGVALIGAFNRPLTGALYDSAYAMTIWGDCARFLPLCIAILWGAATRLPAESLWAAANLGAAPARVSVNIALPLLRGAIAGAWGLAWAWSAGELTIAVLVHGPGGDTLPIPIFNFLHAGIASDVAALCLLLMALCGAAMMLALGVLRRAR